MRIRWARAIGAVICAALFTVIFVRGPLHATTTPIWSILVSFVLLSGVAYWILPLDDEILSIDWRSRETRSRLARSILAGLGLVATVFLLLTFTERMIDPWLLAAGFGLTVVVAYYTNRDSGTTRISANGMNHR